MNKKRKEALVVANEWCVGLSRTTTTGWCNKFPVYIHACLYVKMAQILLGDCNTKQ